MSTDPVPREDVEESTRTAKGGDRDDISTPKSEVPFAVKIMSPSSSGGTVSDYFSAKPPSDEQSMPSLSRTSSRTPAASSIAAASASEVTASGHIEALDGSGYDRPVAQTQLSSLSIGTTDSNVTITAANATTGTANQPYNRPAFPNQSYAALHNQHYPPPHIPPTLRQRSSHPGQIFTFASALASAHQTGARTAGNSPAVTPGAGLFSPRTEVPPEYASLETAGTYSSPFLHFTHRQAPKETHVADVDVDPMTGRKLINHYEVIDELGRGTHGKVKLGRDLHTENSHVAIKIVERFSKRRKLGKLATTEDKIKKEVAILKKARHPHIVALLEVIDDPTRKKVYIVLEWVERGEIQWRVKAPKEVAMVEARRYERERSGRRDALTDAEDIAVYKEAQRRLKKHKKELYKVHRRMLREKSDDPEIWSNEFAGDELSDASEDDRLSRKSTGNESLAGRLWVDERRGSRAPSPLPLIGEAETPSLDIRPDFLPLTSEPQTLSPKSSRHDESELLRTGLEGTMYGAYDPSSSNTSRVSSTDNFQPPPPEPRVSALTNVNTSGLAELAAEILDSDLNPELEYVPIMTMQQARVAVRDTLLGLQYLHYQNIVHRDIKPPNLLQTIDHRVKISDFGVSYLGRPINDGEVGEDISEHEAQNHDEAKELAKTVGTPAFYAPELCIVDPGDDPLPVTKAIDVWALGITLFCMLFARTPFVDNEFVVMRQIADEEIYIPRRRLCPVNNEPRSRPSSRGPAYQTVVSGKRHAYDLVYEDIDDSLYDLLKRLLIKDPRKRITLEEARRHPWLVADLPNKVKWLDETDTSRQSQFKKIEVSNEDVNTAVVPLQFLDRVRSGVKKIGERLGFSSKPTSRGRTHSNAGHASPMAAAPSAGSSSSSISQAFQQDGRRASLRGDESIFTALKASRDAEHPLSRSVAASPELERHEKFFEEPGPGSGYATEDHEPDVQPTPSRTSPTERSRNIMSTAGSGRTLKQADFRKSRMDESPPASPGLPSTPVALDSPGGSGLQAILGSGAARRVFKSLRDRSTPRSRDARGISTDRGSVESFDTHGEPSLAVSQASAAGHVNMPDTLIDIPTSASVPNSAHGSPVSSRPHSTITSPNDNHPFSMAPPRPGAMSRTSSGGSIASMGRLSHLQNTDFKKSLTRPQTRTHPELNAEDERIRRLILEGVEYGAHSRPATPYEERTCPPSPDDFVMRRPDSRQPSVADASIPVSSQETSPTSRGAHLPPVMSSSSDFGSAVSMSISNPSIPSVISEASSVDPTDGMPLEEVEAKLNMSSGETLSGKPGTHDDNLDEGYSPDHEQPLDSDDEGEYDSSSDSDGGLVMSRRRSKRSNPGSLVGADRQNERRGTDLTTRSKKSSRSGSNNTMKKVRTRDSEDERYRASIEE